MDLIKIDDSHEYENQQEWFFKHHKIRTIMISGVLWWILKDVCDALGIINSSQAAERLDHDERSMFNIGRQGNVNIINESGLYKIILRSDKPEAKKFTRWITHEVLPQIRSHGAYITKSKAEELLNDPGTWAELLLAVQREQIEKRLLLEKTEQLEAKIESDAPKILFADSVAAADTTISIADLSKILKANGIETGQKRMFQRLRSDGFLIKRPGADYNSPSQKSMELGLFRITETAIARSDGRITISKTSKVTGRGQTYFIDYFLSKTNKNEVSHDEDN